MNVDSASILVCVMLPFLVHTSILSDAIYPLMYPYPLLLAPWVT